MHKLIKYRALPPTKEKICPPSNIRNQIGFTYENGSDYPFTTEPFSSQPTKKFELKAEENIKLMHYCKTFPFVNVNDVLYTHGSIFAHTDPNWVFPEEICCHINLNEGHQFRGQSGNEYVTPCTYPPPSKVDDFHYGHQTLVLPPSKWRVTSIETFPSFKEIIIKEIEEFRFVFTEILGFQSNEQWLKQRGLTHASNVFTEARNLLEKLEKPFDIHEESWENSSVLSVVTDSRLFEITNNKMSLYDRLIETMSNLHRSSFLGKSEITRAPKAYFWYKDEHTLKVFQSRKVMKVTLDIVEQYT